MRSDNEDGIELSQDLNSGASPGNEQAAVKNSRKQTLRGDFAANHANGVAVGGSRCLERLA
jgi:hypothetical protein